MVLNGSRKNLERYSKKVIVHSLNLTGWSGLINTNLSKKDIIDKMMCLSEEQRIQLIHGYHGFKNTLLRGTFTTNHKWVKITNNLHRCVKCRELRIKAEFSTYYINVKNYEKRKTAGSCKGKR